MRVQHSRRVSRALRAADAGEAYHWPTIAANLAREVRRLVALLETEDKVKSHECID